MLFLMSSLILKPKDFLPLQASFYCWSRETHSQFYWISAVKAAVESLNGYPSGTLPFLVSMKNGMNLIIFTLPLLSEKGSWNSAMATKLIILICLKQHTFPLRILVALRQKRLKTFISSCHISWCAKYLTLDDLACCTLYPLSQYYWAPKG